MLNILKAKKKRKTMAPYILENLTAVMTLSDRLRQAGIRECEPDYDTKNSKNRKFNSERQKKLQNLAADFYSSYFKDTYQSEACRGKPHSKNYKGFSRTLRRRIRGSAKKTLSASLNFIKDCQKYKKKVRTPKSHSLLKSHQKNASISRDLKQPQHVKEEPSKLQDEKTDCQMLSCNIRKVDSAVLNFSAKESSDTVCVREDSSFNKESSENVHENNATIKVEIRKRSEIKQEETLSYGEPFIDKLPSGDVARIDKKYLESLLSIANGQESNDRKKIKEDETKKSAEATAEKKEKKKKKKIDKAFPENNTTANQAQDMAAKMQKDCTSKSQILYEDLVPARVLRDSTKSEVQIILQTEKNFNNQRNSEMKSEKNMTQNKLEDDTRKKRKNRNKLLKSKNGEFLNSTSPKEVSKVADVKELWRRESREKSENSLSSNSSCNVPENEQVSERKNLGFESYNVLHKIVAEEVKKISKKPENKDNTGQIENRSKPNEMKEVKPAKGSGKGTKPLIISSPEISKDVPNKPKNEVTVLRKKLIQTENQQRHSNYEGEEQNVQLLSLLVEDNLKDKKAKLKLIREKEEKIGKTASQIVQNWSILNRLEQAFVALGTPDFQNKNLKGPKALKKENSTSSEKITMGNVYVGKIQEEHFQRVNKIPLRSKEAAEKKYHGDSTNVLRTNTKTLMQSSQNKKPENDRKRNLLKENQQGNNTKRDFKKEGLQNGSFQQKVLEGKENKTKKECNTKQKKGNISNETTYGTSSKKPTTLKTFANTKLNEYEFQHEKKNTKDLKYAVRDRLTASAKNYYQKKSTTNLELNNSSGISLERKRTFDVIPNKNISQIEESVSYIIIPNNVESDGSKKHFLQNKFEIKSNNFIEKNVKTELKLGRKNRENDTGIKRKPAISKNSAKTPNKEKPTNSNEKEYLKRSRESSVKISKGKTNLEKNCEKSEPMEALPQQILAKKELNSNERATKERSILSMRGNQQNTEELTKKMMQIEEKSTSDFSPALKSSTGNFLIRKAQKNLDDLLEKSAKLAQSDFSKISFESISNYKLLEFNSMENQNEVAVDNQENKRNFSKKLTPLFGCNDGFITPEKNKVGTDNESIPMKFHKYQPLWEQDIRHYHAIVKDIMSQYKRLNGFLKQSDQLETFPNDSVNLVSTEYTVNDDSSNLSNISTTTDLREYRKKIISEYKALPIFEYKRKLEQMKEENLKEAKKRNLLVVRDIKADMDLDIKDFQPKIQKILDSQLYVDTESLVRRNHPNVKFKEKNSSLQEIVLGKNEKMYSKEECTRSNSTPKTFLLLSNSSFNSRSNQKLKTVENYQENLFSAITSVSCLEETESEIL